MVSVRGLPPELWDPLGAETSGGVPRRYLLALSLGCLTENLQVVDQRLARLDHLAQHSYLTSHPCSQGLVRLAAYLG